MTKTVSVKIVPDTNREQNEYVGKYYMVGSGEKYHTENCSYVKNATELSEITKEDIEIYGYEPCKRCIK